MSLLEKKSGSKRSSRPPDLSVFAATCTASLRLSREIGLPIILLSVATNVAATVRELNAKKYGSFTLWPVGPNPFLFESGWDDWRVCAFADPHATVCDSAAYFSAGIIKISTRDEFQHAEQVFKQVLSVLHRVNYNVILRNPRWIYARCASSLPIIVHPRYVMTGDPYADMQIVDNLFVIDPFHHVDGVLEAVRSALPTICNAADRSSATIVPRHAAWAHQ